MPCFRVFDLFRGSPVFGDKTEQVVAAPASHAGFRSLKITSYWARRMPSIAVSVEALDCGTAERWQASSPTSLRPLPSKADRQHTSKKPTMISTPAANKSENDLTTNCVDGPVRAKYLGD